MVKTVIFDLGNVILPFDVLRLANRLTTYSPYSADDIITKLWNEQLADDFETGKMSDAAYFDHISEICQFKNLTYDVFLPIFNDIFIEDQAVVGLINDLKGKYNLGLISNTNAIHVAHIMKTYSSLKLFDHLCFSNEVGLRKPDKKIYEKVLTHFKTDPHETVFIDDMEQNLHGSSALGIHGIHYKSADQLKKELDALGVNVPSQAA